MLQVLQANADMQGIGVSKLFFLQRKDVTDAVNTIGISILGLRHPMIPAQPPLLPTDEYGGSTLRFFANVGSHNHGNSFWANK
jgi:hypothetical protein